MGVKSRDLSRKFGDVFHQETFTEKHQRVLKSDLKFLGATENNQQIHPVREGDLLFMSMSFHDAKTRQLTMHLL